MNQIKEAGASPDQGYSAHTQGITCTAIIPPLGVSTSTRRYARMRRVREVNARIERREHNVEVALVVMVWWLVVLWLS